MKLLLKKKIIIAILCSLIIISNITAFPVYANSTTRLSTNSLTDIELNIHDWKNVKTGTYPIDNSSAIWNSLSYIDALNVCNMPLELTKSLSTKELVEYAMNYPLLTDIFCFNSITDGFEHLRRTSTLFAELFARPDCATAFFSYYSNTSCNYTVLTKSNDMINSNYLKLLFIEEYFGSQFMNLSPQLQNDFINKFEEKYLEKAPSIRAYRSSTIFYDALSETVDLIPSEAIPSSIKYDIINRQDSAGPSFTQASPNLVQNPVNYTYAYYGYETINKKNIYGYLYVSGDLTPAEIESADNSFGTQHPSFIRLRSATKKYNCHSYAWFSTFATNSFWMLDPTSLANDTTYFTPWVASMGSPTPGSKLIFFNSYGTPIHSAIYNSTGPSRCTSKLGSAGVYNTSIDEIIALYGSTSYQAYIPK